eukprot:227324-Alexandrium_andersonii.AAC.1
MRCCSMTSASAAHVGDLRVPEIHGRAAWARADGASCCIAAGKEFCVYRLAGPSTCQCFTIRVGASVPIRQ